MQFFDDWLRHLLNDLGLERFGVRVSLAQGNPGVKSDRVRLKLRIHHRLYGWILEAEFAGRLLLFPTTAVNEVGCGFIKNELRLAEAELNQASYQLQVNMAVH